MKRVSLAALSLLAAVSFLTPQPARAEWVQKEVKWAISSVGSPFNATAIYVRDTTFNVVAAGQTDTISAFSLSDAYPWRDGHAGVATSNDTITVGYLIIQQDSAAAVASTISSVTYEIDGRCVGTGTATALNQWVQVDSIVAPFNSATGGSPYNSIISLPLRAINATNEASGLAAINQFYRIMAYDALRVRLTSVTGIITSARVWLRYWRPDVAQHR